MNVYIPPWKGLLVVFLVAFLAALVVSGAAQRVAVGTSADFGTEGKGGRHSFVAIPEATLVVDYGNGQKRTFKGEVAEGMSVLHMIQLVGAGVDNFDIELSGTLWSHVVSAVDGVKNESEGETWQVYRNGEKQETPLETVPLEAKDIIELRYE